MLIIASSDMPPDACNRLQREGEVLWLNPQPQVYDSIATHPDIFFCQAGNLLVASPGIPPDWKQQLALNNIPVVYGRENPSEVYPGTARYNAVVTSNMLIHNKIATDPVIVNGTLGLININVSQGYTRCNLLAMNNDHFISSDKGISDALIRTGATVLTVNPKGILLKGQKHGFFGGACGIRDNELFVCGNLDYYSDGVRVKDFACACGYSVTELYDGLLTDVGGILFVKDLVR